MLHIKHDPVLYPIFQRVVELANGFGRTLPEMRFFVLRPLEFASLLEKHVYPTSPANIWEGRNMVNHKHRVETGQESSLYYEVVQTGNPSYGYLNQTNNAMMQASVMAHVVGHCEFSELNVLKDSNSDRTEWVMHLVKQVNLARPKMGELHYREFWNACESISPLINPNSQYNLENAIESDRKTYPVEKNIDKNVAKKNHYQPFSSTMSSIFKSYDMEESFKEELQKKSRNETLSRKGYKLRVPCQDIFGFLARYAPCSESEKTVLHYLYTINIPHDFVVRTQIMNEGWAMYWEKKIMLELFKEKVVKGVIDYSKVFSGVCYPRPYYMRNPYHLGFHLWCHIEELYQKGKVSLKYHEETSSENREKWNKNGVESPIESMTHLVKTITDYEFLRRFLTDELVFKFHLNRIERNLAFQMGVSRKDVVKEDNSYVWLNPSGVKNEMLQFFTHFHRPRIYVIDNDYQDGGLLLFHRDDGRNLKKTWIEPTLKNIHYVWKGSVSLYSRRKIYHYRGNKFSQVDCGDLPFDKVLERMLADQKPFVDK